MKLDVVVAGVGGQGVVVISDIFCEAALLDGFDVAKAEIHGMAQRGGAIVAHVRIGDKVQAPLIARGTADIVLGFELLETARAMSMLKPKGTVVVNTKYMPPNAVFTSGYDPLSQEQLLSLIQARARAVHQIDGVGIATQLGNLLVVNTVLLGALSALPENPVGAESLKKAMASRLKEKYVNLNLKAFQIGRNQVKMS
jgi:indolepyruvate ferredoxin oxidoreductase beta subunit